MILTRLPLLCSVACVAAGIGPIRRTENNAAASARPSVLRCCLQYSMRFRVVVLCIQMGSLHELQTDSAHNGSTDTNKNTGQQSNVQARKRSNAMETSSRHRLLAAREELRSHCGSSDRGVPAYIVLLILLRRYESSYCTT